MRSYLIEQLQKENIDIEEGSSTIEDVLNADEIFLTNAIQGIRWVKSLENKTYTVHQAAQLVQQFIGKLF